MDPFAERLRYLRQQRGMTQLHLATDIGISDSMYRQYESGISKPSYIHLIALAEYYHLSLDYLTCRSNFSLPLDSENAMVLTPDEQQVILRLRAARR